MTLMKWSSNLSVNVQEIDSQHEKLVGYINNLNDAMRKGQSKAVIGDILNSLVDYTKVHFSTEERYFDKFGYPETAAHKSEHQKFVESVLQFKKEFDQGDALISISVLSFLRDWLIKHINGVDKKYGPFLNEHGVH